MKFLISLIILVTIINSKLICADVKVSNDRVNPESTQDRTRDIELPFPLPIEDTYEFDEAELSLPGEILSANVNITKGSISGVSGFRLLELNISDTEPMIGLNIIFPLLKLHAENYVLEGNIYNAVPIKGKGVAHIEIFNLQICGELYMKESAMSNAVLFDKFENADIHIERIVSQTDFDHNIDNIISALVEDVLADYINRFNKYFIAKYTDTVIQYINTIIEVK